MITSVRGSLEKVGPAWAEIALGGVTVRVNVPPSEVERLGGLGDQVRLFTSLQVREDSLALYGFLTEEARQAFEALLGVNGIGPKLALSVLSALTPDELASAVASEDADAFKGIPGVGKKTASRIILELKGKLGKDWTVEPAVAGQGEVIEALTALGYTLSEAREAVSNLPAAAPMTLEEKVRLALQHIGGR